MKNEKARKRRDEAERPIVDGKSKHATKVKRFASVTPGTQAKHHKWWTTLVILVAVVIVTQYLKPKKDIKLAVHNEVVPLRFHTKECSQQLLDETKVYPNCVPKRCGRLVTDSLISQEEAGILLETAESGIALAGSSGGASILDLHSGALSKGDHFIDAFNIPEFKNMLSKDFITAYKSITLKIKTQIATNFLVDENELYLTHPTFFSRISNATAKTLHDEYWHPHVDKEQYEAFHYTSLLYLNTFKKDFDGGRFVFIDGKDKNETKVYVEPKSGRVNAFTSGHENVHHIEPVITGLRYALTVSFTCNSTLAVDNNFHTNYDD